MTKQEKTEAFADLIQGWQNLFSEIKQANPGWSDEQVADLAGKIITEKLFS